MSDSRISDMDFEGVDVNLHASLRLVWRLDHRR